MALFDSKSMPPLGQLVREALEHQVPGSYEENITGAIRTDPDWVGRALSQVGDRMGWTIEESAQNELASILRGALRLVGDASDVKDTRNAIDNVQSLIVMALLVANLRDESTIDRAAISTAYQLACPMYPCMPGTSAGRGELSNLLAR
jgi:hypothetical protein